MKQFYSLACISILILLFSITAQAQNTQSATKYVRVDIGHGGLHCPFLGPKMEKMYRELSDVSNLKIYKQESYATFELPAQSVYTDEELRQVAIKAGYPKTDVSVSVSDTPPVNQQ